VKNMTKTEYKDINETPEENNFNFSDHFARCKQHWSRSTSCFSFL